MATHDELFGTIPQAIRDAAEADLRRLLPDLEQSIAELRKSVHAMEKTRDQIRAQLKLPPVDASAALGHHHQVAAVLDHTGQIAVQPQVQTQNEFPVGFFAYETVGFTPLTPAEELLARLQTMLRQTLHRYVGETNTPQLCERLSDECTEMLRQFHPSIRVTATPTIDPDRVNLTIASDNPAVKAIFHDIAEPSGPVDVRFTLDADGRVVAGQAQAAQAARPPGAAAAGSAAENRQDPPPGVAE